MVFFWYVFLGLLLLGVAGWLVYELFKGDFEPQDLTIANNYMKKYADGYSDLLILGSKEYDKRTKIEYKPKDVDYMKIKVLGKKYNPEKKVLWVRNDMIEHHPRSTKSDHRNKITIYPPFPEDIPEYLKGTEEGRYVMERIEKKRHDSLIASVLRNAMTSKEEALRKMNDGELTSEYMHKIDTFYNQMIDKALNQKKDDFKGMPNTSNSLHQGGI